jgi:hypothetical protein
MPTRTARHAIAVTVIFALAIIAMVFAWGHRSRLDADPQMVVSQY